MCSLHNCFDHIKFLSHIFLVRVNWNALPDLSSSIAGSWISSKELQ